MFPSLLTVLRSLSIENHKSRMMQKVPTGVSKLAMKQPMCFRNSGRWSEVLPVVIPFSQALEVYGFKRGDCFVGRLLEPVNQQGLPPETAMVDLVCKMIVYESMTMRFYESIYDCIECICNCN